jgi:trimethyllysine dioxygenase
VKVPAIFQEAVKYADYISEEGEEKAYKDVLGRLRRDGFAVISGCPTTPKGTGDAIERIGFVRRTMYSDGVWDTAVRPTAQDDDTKAKKVMEEVKSRVTDQYSTGVVDTAYTNLELYPHTDCTYYRDPPALQVFEKVSNFTHI